MRANDIHDVPGINIAKHAFFIIAISVFSNRPLRDWRGRKPAFERIPWIHAVTRTAICAGMRLDADAETIAAFDPISNEVFTATFEFNDVVG